MVERPVPNWVVVGSSPIVRSRCFMDDSKKVVLLESTLREILRINDAASKGSTGSIPLETALYGDLFYSWIDIREKAKLLLKGQAR